jgi:tripartite-type tricarboxylate transporter receptor subunit TctC
MRHYARHFGIFVATCVGVLPTAFAAGAADFPNKPIQLIVPYAAGGSTDVMARAIAETLSAAPRGSE